MRAGARTIPVRRAEELQRLGRHIEQAPSHRGVRVLGAVMEEAHAARLHGIIIAQSPQSPVSLDITAQTEYGSEAGSDFVHEFRGRGLSNLPTARQYNNVERDLTPSAIGAILEESPEPEVQAPPRRLRWQSYTLVALLMIALGTLGYGVYLKWKTSRASASVSNLGALALRAERREGALRVSWNRDTPVVNHAKDGTLSIRDGDLQPQELHLELEQLRTGSVVYSPTNESVLFRLEVTSRDETKTHETTLALAATKAHLTAVAASRPAAGSSSRNRKSFSPPRSRHDFGKPSRVMLVDPPAQAASFLGASALVEQLAIAQPKVAPFPPPDPQQDRITPREPQPLPVTPAFVAARPIHESMPNLPRAIRDTVTSEVEVQIKVQVDESGRVKRIAPLGSTGPASDSIISASAEAARHWRFAPAMRGNEPVESEVVLTFRYTPKTAGN